MQPQNTLISLSDGHNCPICVPAHVPLFAAAGVEATYF
jgi:hypothetical protein